MFTKPILIDDAIAPFKLYPGIAGILPYGKWLTRFSQNCDCSAIYCKIYTHIGFYGKHPVACIALDYNIAGNTVSGATISN